MLWFTPTITPVNHASRQFGTSQNKYACVTHVAQTPRGSFVSMAPVHVCPQEMESLLQEVERAGKDAPVDPVALQVSDRGAVTGHTLTQ
jgi:hypothetical protein